MRVYLIWMAIFLGEIILTIAALNIIIIVYHKISDRPRKYGK
jgi:hypothetical protein